MTPTEIIEKEISKPKWYVGITPQSTASNFVASWKRGQLKKKTIDKYLKKMGYHKIKEEQWEKKSE